MRILVINPGSTSTKLAVFEDNTCIWVTGAHHPTSDLAPFHHINEQYEYRRKFILDLLQQAESKSGLVRALLRQAIRKPE